MNGRHIVLFIFLVCSFFSVSSQSILTGNSSLTFSDSARNNRSIPVEIYYPADSSGNNVPISLTHPGKFPVLVFGHGFLMTWESYEFLWESLIPAGYIMVFPKTESGFSPQHNELAIDLAFLVKALKSEGGNPASLFYQRIDTASCVMGHSMGGGSSFLSIQYDSSITALVNFAAAETNPSAISATSMIQIPTLIFSGENDCVTPPVSNQIPMFDSLQSECKYLLKILGGSHCQMAEDNVFCSLGESSCSPPPVISRLRQHEIILRFLIPWLDARLKGDCASQSVFDSLLLNDTSINFSGNCTLCSLPTGLLTMPDNSGWKIYPVPFSNELNIQADFSIGGLSKFEIFNSYGHLVDHGVIDDNFFRINFKDRPQCPGLYYLRLIYSGKTEVFPLSRFVQE